MYSTTHASIRANMAANVRPNHSAATFTLPINAASIRCGSLFRIGYSACALRRRCQPNPRNTRVENGTSRSVACISQPFGDASIELLNRIAKAAMGSAPMKKRGQAVLMKGDIAIFHEGRSGPRGIMPCDGPAAPPRVVSHASG
ncbi:hypothetical protein BN126320095 [Stenotrophomonas indicatrix]|nr:hypothetical protein BN126320095 [Stenotrophomonas indicatrix]